MKLKRVPYLACAACAAYMLCALGALVSAFITVTAAVAATSHWKDHPPAAPTHNLRITRSTASATGTDKPVSAVVQPEPDAERYAVLAVGLLAICVLKRHREAQAID